MTDVQIDSQPEPRPSIAPDRLILQRKGHPQEEHVALAFAFTGRAGPPAHPVTTVRWTDGAVTRLQQLHTELRGQHPEAGLPVTSLRSSTLR